MKGSKYNKPKTRKIKGMNIYIDGRDRTVYYDILTKIGYVIEESNQNIFYVFQNRFLIVIFGMILSVDFILDFKLTIAIGLIVCIVFELVFRFWYLPKLKVLDDFVPRKKLSLLNGLIYENNPKKTILKVVLYGAFSILLLVNAISQKMELLLIVLCSVLSVVAMYYSIIHIIGLTKMNKGNLNIRR